MKSSKNKNIIKKEEMNKMLETAEILSNPNTIEQIRVSEQNIKTGRIKSVKSVRDIERFI